jgi:GxxExxY protein
MLDYPHKELTGAIIGAAMEVHKALGPGLLESAYEECLCRELALKKLAFQRQVELPVYYKGVKLDCGYRMDLVVADRVVVEIKSVDLVMPIREAQLLTYLRLSQKPIGLLIKFKVSVLKDGVTRKIL